MKDTISGPDFYDRGHGQTKPLCSRLTTNIIIIIHKKAYAVLVDVRLPPLAGESGAVTTGCCCRCVGFGLAVAAAEVVVVVVVTAAKEVVAAVSDSRREAATAAVAPPSGSVLVVAVVGGSPLLQAIEQ